MSDHLFAILLIIVLLCFAGVGVALLLWPSKFLRHFQNPLQPDTPLNRVYMRAVGVFVCLFVSVQQVNRRYLAGEAEEPHWELRMSVAFCSLLSVIVLAACLLAMKGIFPK